MKRIFFFLMLVAALLAFAAVGTAEERIVDAAALDVLGAAHAGYAVVSPTQWGDTAAAALCKDGENILCIAEKQNGAWRVTIDHKMALRQGEKLPSLLLDTDTVLFWSYQLGERTSCFYCAVCDGGLWRVTDWRTVVPYDGGIREEFISFSTAGDVPVIVKTVYREDENENVLSFVDSIPYPIGALADLMPLAAFDVTRFPTCDYPMTDLTNEPIKAAAASSLFPDDTYLGGSLTDTSMQFLLSKPDGVLVLAGITFTETDGWKTVESTPLPKGTVYGYQNFATSLYFPNGLLADVSLFTNGQWGISLIYSTPPDNEMLVLGENWIADQLLAPNTRYYGDHPWSDITAMDWNTLPMSLESAVHMLDQSAWAVVSNPNPEDRLHLRTQPQKDAPSLGKYYNGTAVRVLGENGDWLHVSVYGAEGWMMKRYLARSEAMNAVTSNGPTLSFVTYPALLYESPKSEYPFCKLVGDEDCFDMRVLGVVSDRWLHVWFMISGRSGYVLQDALTSEND
ncbi:MAG: SH3 domain-containing protein [Clostridia bacterium]